MIKARFVNKIGSLGSACWPRSVMWMFEFQKGEKVSRRRAYWLPFVCVALRLPGSDVFGIRL